MKNHPFFRAPTQWAPTVHGKGDLRAWIKSSSPQVVVDNECVIVHQWTGSRTRALFFPKYDGNFLPKAVALFMLGKHPSERNPGWWNTTFPFIKCKRNMCPKPSWGVFPLQAQGSFTLKDDTGQVSNVGREATIWNDEHHVEVCDHTPQSYYHHIHEYYKR